MAGAHEKSERVRLFTALDLPQAVREALAGWQARELADPALRAVAPEALHITLCFLGHLPQGDAEAAARIVEAIRPRPVELRLDAEPQPIPRNRPRLFAIDAAGDAAVELQGELSGRLEEAGLLEPEKRPFRPHVTVARVRRERGRSGASRRVRRPPGALPGALLEPFGAVRVALYRSNLRPTGAEYVPMAGIDLPPTGAEKR
jgi:2'-5' RNA ligase